MFQLGKGCEEEDPSKAFQYFMESAEMGNIDAMNKVGFCYLYKGRCAPFDVEKSVYWFEKGANGGNVRCMMMLVHFYLSGVGVQQSDEIARKLLQIALKSDEEKIVAIEKKRLNDFEGTRAIMSALMKTAVKMGGIPPKK